MLGPTAIEFGSLFIGEREFPFTLGVGETLPQRHGEVSTIAGGKLQELRERGRFHAPILSRAAPDRQPR